jgi:pterin-4a-carbinolamine dehydratase
VTVAITNHAEGGLTEADFELAGRISEIASLRNT